VSKEEQEAKMPDEVEPVIYIGPSSNKLGLDYLHVYAQLNDTAQEALKQFPALGMLLISVSRFAAIRQQVYNREPGSITHAIDNLNSQGVI